MIWDVAAGVIVGGTALGLVVFGIGAQIEAMRHNDRDFGYGWLMALAGVGLSVWIVFFKAHF